MIDPLTAAREWLTKHYPNHARSAEGIDTLPAMLAAYARAERERCAQIAESRQWEFEGGRQTYEERRQYEIQRDTCTSVAAAIRREKR